MARRYTRDNRGRFASGGGGATARGGRLRTAAGNKRATQTMRAQGAGGAGVIKGRAARTVAGESVMRKLPKAAPKVTAKVDDAKVSRVIGRANNVVRGAEQKTGIKRLNATQVGVRAKSFLARKEGGNVGILNQKSQPEAFASVRKAMTKPPRYSTQTPNRNKPGRFNDLGQDKARAKAKLEARTARDRIRGGNAAAKAKSDKAKPSRLLGRREIYGGTMGAPGDAKGPRIKGTIAKPKAPKAAPSSLVARTRKQAGNYQRARTKDRLAQVKYTQAASRGMGSASQPFYVGKQLKRSDTGMRQLSLTGSAKTLYKFKRVGKRK